MKPRYFQHPRLLRQLECLGEKFLLSLKYKLYFQIELYDFLVKILKLV